MSLSVVILAAGKGTRMKSSKPKVLHPLAGKPLLEHVYDTAMELGAEQVIVVYGHGGDAVKDQCKHFNAEWIEQKQQLGTGHAVIQVLDSLKAGNQVLVLYGDVPLTSKETLLELLKTDHGQLGLLTVRLDKPEGYGRIIRDAQSKVVAIVEQKDANNEQLEIDEVNTGILCCESGILKKLLSQISCENAQGEYYLTDIFAFASQDGIGISTTTTANKEEVEGINDRVQLARLERVYQQQQAAKLMHDGVTLADPERIDIRGHVSIMNDVYIDINVILQGDIRIGSGCHIGANTVISNSSIGDNVEIRENCVIENSIIHNECVIGPFARLRPDTEINNKARIGNFVEIKKANIGEGSKVNHLSYIGDTEMGCNVNVGAGTITCNYDGAYKHKTVIGDNVFIGSDSQLVAPVKIADGVTIGAGATVTKDIDEDCLVISRSPQKSIKGWKRPVKNKK